MSNFFSSLFRKAKKPTPSADQIKHEDVFSKTYRFIAIDVETANSDPSSICQIGFALTDFEGEISVVSYLADPQQKFESFNVALHGINEKTVRTAPIFSSIINEHRSFLESHPLVQHSSFDSRAIKAACNSAKTPNLSANWFDSVTIARTAWPQLKGNGGHGLANLKDFLNLNFDHHDAGEDAKAAAMVVLRAEAETGLGFSELAAPSSTRKKTYPKSVSVEGKKSGPLFGDVACFTGRLSMSRVEAATIAAAAGISVKNSVSKNVTLLVVGDQDLELLAGHEKSSKHRKAEELVAQGHALRILGEAQFLALIDET